MCGPCPALSRPWRRERSGPERGPIIEEARETHGPYQPQLRDLDQHEEQELHRAVLPRQNGLCEGVPAWAEVPSDRRAGAEPRPARTSWCQTGSDNQREAPYEPTTIVAGLTDQATVNGEQDQHLLVPETHGLRYGMHGGLPRSAC